MEFNFTKSQLEVLQKLVEYPDDFKYPVGTILASDDVHAVDNIGGQWEQIEDKFLLGAGSTFAVNSTGGEINHKLEEHEMPSHTHEATWVWDQSGNYLIRINAVGSSSTSINSARDVGLVSKGGSQPHNNMPPYMAKYMWIKTKLQSELEGGNV